MPFKVQGYDYSFEVYLFTLDWSQMAKNVATNTSRLCQGLFKKRVLLYPLSFLSEWKFIKVSWSNHSAVSQNFYPLLNLPPLKNLVKNCVFPLIIFIQEKKNQVYRSSSLAALNIKKSFKIQKKCLKGLTKNKN